MKKNLSISFLLLGHLGFAGTGGARDANFFMLSMIAILSIVLVVLYSIDFIRRFIKEHKEKKLAHSMHDTNGDTIA